MKQYIICAYCHIGASHVLYKHCALTSSGNKHLWLFVGADGIVASLWLLTQLCGAVVDCACDNMHGRELHASTTPYICSMHDDHLDHHIWSHNEGKRIFSA